MVRMITFISVCFIASLANAQDLIFSEMLAPGYELRWSYNEEDITFQLSAPTRGWVGIGFSPGRTMEGADLILCGVRISGGNYIWDTHALGNNVPLVDTMQDAVVDEASERDGGTTIRFTRKRITGDPDDMAITDGAMNVLWAHGEGDIADIPTFFDYHNNDKGFRRIQFIRRVPRPPVIPSQVPTFTSPTSRTFPVQTFTQPPSQPRIITSPPVTRTPRNFLSTTISFRPVKTSTQRIIWRTTTEAKTAPPPTTTRRPIPASTTTPTTEPTVVYTSSRRTSSTFIPTPGIPDGKPPLDLPYYTTLDPLGRVELKWGIAGENFVIEISAPTQGWIGFGISPGGTMARADMIIMGVRDGQGYAWDTFADVNGPPTLDQSQDATLLWFSQNGTHTTVMAHRYIRTPDPEDVNIQEGVVNVIWAYGNTDFNEIAIVESYHGRQRGTKRLDLLQLPTEGFVGPATLPPLPLVTSQEPQSSLRLENTEILNQEQTVTMKWVVDGQSIIIQLTAPTRGWIGMGFSPSGTMEGADILMMGSSQGQGFVLDTHALRNGLPLVDESQDAKIMMSNFNGSHTTVMIHRLLDTGDPDDMAIMDVPMHIIWAFGSDDITNNISSNLYHGRRNRGSKLINLISPSNLEQGKTSELPTTTTPSVPPKTTSAKTSTTPQTSSTTTAQATTSTIASTTTGTVTAATSKVVETPSKLPPSTPGPPTSSKPPTKPPKSVPASVSVPEVGERSLLLPGFGLPPPSPKMVKVNLSNAATLDNDGNVVLHWSVEGDYIHLEMTAPTLGWLGVGFSPDGTMHRSDVIIMGVRNNEGYALDAFVKSGHLPIPDEIQNVEVIFYKEIGDHTTVRVKRPLKTNDKMDRPLTEGEMYVIWAYGQNEVISKPARSNYHGRTNRGSKKLTFIHTEKKSMTKTIVLSITAFSALLILLAWKLLQ